MIVYLMDLSQKAMGTIQENAMPTTSTRNKTTSTKSNRKTVSTRAAAPPPMSRTPFVCDWSQGSTKGVCEVVFEFTRPMPKGAWLARLHTYYVDGKVTHQDIQIYDPIVSAAGTTWGFQTTDGKWLAKLFVQPGGGEFRIAESKNGYLLEGIVQSAFSLMASTSGKAVTAKTGSNEWLQQLADIAKQKVIDNCKKHPIKCGILLFKLWLTQTFPGHEPDMDAELDALHQNWINFVNGELGPCESSHLCPGGTNCVGGKCVQIFK